MDKNIQGRIQQMVDEICGGNKSEFTRRIGKPNSAVKDIIGGKGSAPGYEMLYSILTSDLGISPKWLMCGDGEMMKTQTREEKRKELPLLPFDAVAGFLANNIPDSFAFSEETYSVPEFTARGADFAIRVCGDSMQPKYNNGDILAAKVIKDPSFFQWGRCYILSTSQGCVVKRLYPDPNDKNLIVCHSENTASFPDYEIPRDEIYAVALVIGHIGAE